MVLEIEVVFGDPKGKAGIVETGIFVDGVMLLIPANKLVLTEGLGLIVDELKEVLFTTGTLLLGLNVLGEKLIVGTLLFSELSTEVEEIKLVATVVVVTGPKLIILGGKLGAGVFAGLETAAATGVDGDAIVC